MKICIDESCYLFRNKLYRLQDMIRYLRKLADESATPKEKDILLMKIRSITDDSINDLWEEDRIKYIEKKYENYKKEEE